MGEDTPGKHLEQGRVTWDTCALTSDKCRGHAPQPGERTPVPGEGWAWPDAGPALQVS